jgi:hypothetical protein
MITPRAEAGRRLGARTAAPQEVGVALDQSGRKTRLGLGRGLPRLARRDGGSRFARVVSAAATGDEAEQQRSR